MSPTLHSLDHLVLTVADLGRTCAFYETVLGMRISRFSPGDGSTRWALFFGSQKINLHVAGAEYEPKAAFPQPGCADLCFLSDTALTEWEAHLAAHDVTVELGPLPRSGAQGPIRSLYIRDPDGNLIEIANRV